MTFGIVDGEVSRPVHGVIFMIPTKEIRMANDLKDIMAFVATEEKPLEKGEFMEFWKNLTDEEKEEFRNAELS